LRDDFAGQRQMQGITMPVQIAALTVVIRNAMPGIKFKLSGNREHDVTS
jgi:hypothetical protein